MGFETLTVGARKAPFFVPRRTREPRPLVVFLHGVGENGTDGGRHLAVGLPPYVREHEESFPAYALFPQCRGPWKYVGEDERHVLDALAAARRDAKVDPKRVYLTGLSQGGCSTFELGAKHAGLWAALVVVCGAGRPAFAPALENLPIWIFHGENDPVVPPSGPHQWDAEDVGGRDMARLLPHARYTEYPGADHFIWDRVYRDAEMWGWLLSQERP
jgi:predicted peptidase